MSVSPSRSIIHCDMDAFYAAVEQLDHPEFRGRPVIVGGDLRRGVVSACSYEARHFGIHSAQPMALAVRYCPQAVVLPVRIGRYRELSRKVFSIFSRYTDRIEPLSIDEAFLDVTGCERLFGPPKAIASAIRTAVRAELGLAVSAGVASNKFLAKLACQQAKPDGLLEVTDQEISTFLTPLPVEALWGVGAVTAELLKKRGVHTVGELQSLPSAHLAALLGQGGEQLYRLARGIDDRPVARDEEVKSVSHEVTFGDDLHDIARLKRELLDLAERVAARLRAQCLTGRRVTLKVRYGDFKTVTRSRTLSHGVDNGRELLLVGIELLARTEAADRPVRLLGLGVAEFLPKMEVQEELFEPSQERQRRQALDRAADLLRGRFGRPSLGPADLLEGRAAEGGSALAEEGDDGGEGA